MDLHSGSAAVVCAVTCLLISSLTCSRPFSPSLPTFIFRIMPWGSKPATVLRKVTLVAADAATGRLPVHTLTFAVPAGVGDYLGTRIDYGDVVKCVIPGYKPKSFSMSAQRPGEFDITFKVYPGGRASPYLDSLQVGQTLDVFPRGSKDRNPGALVGIVAFGVGITEALPMAAAELSKPDAKSVVLMWCSRTTGDTFWRDQLAALRAAHGDRFGLVEMLSREDTDREGTLKGRVSPEALTAVLDGRWGTGRGGGAGANEALRSEVRLLSVGTKDMMRMMDGMFGEIGYPMPDHALLR